MKSMTTNLSASVAESAAGVTPLRAWAPALAAIGVIGAVFGLVFQREIVGALTVWTGSTAYNHCFLVLPMVAVLLWGRRDLIASARPRPAMWALVLVPALSTGWAAGALLDILEARQLLVVALFEALLVAILGWRVFRALQAPLLFLFFLVPFGAFLVPALQRFTAGFAADGLAMLGIPVFANGFVIQIPEGSFEVAEACAGLRFLIASIVFGCFFATIVYRGRLRRLIFIGLSIVLPILANGLRALGLIALAHVEGSAVAMETDHILYGWLFFTLVTLALTAIGMTFGDRGQGVSAPPVASPTPGRCPRVAVAAGAGLLLAMVGPVALTESARASAAPLPPASFAPLHGGVWVREPAAAVGWRPLVRGATRKGTVTYRDNDASVSEFVALYRLPALNSSLTRTVNRVADPKVWQTVATGRAMASFAGRRIAVNTATIASHGHERLVWWFYVVDGHATGSRFEAKLLQARTALFAGAHVGAYVALSTETHNPASKTHTLARFAQALILGTVPAGSRLRR